MLERTRCIRTYFSACSRDFSDSFWGPGGVPRVSLVIISSCHCIHCLRPAVLRSGLKFGLLQRYSTSSKHTTQNMSTGPLCEASGADSTTRIFELEQLVRDKLKWLPAVYNYILYWDALVKLCEERRNMMVVASHWRKCRNRRGRH